MTSTPPEPSDVLMGGSSVPTLGFAYVGSTVGGSIVAPPRTYHTRAYNPEGVGKGDLQFFPSGDPIYGVHIDVRASEPSDDDDGVRRLYVEKRRMKEAVRDAMIAARRELKSARAVQRRRRTRRRIPPPGMRRRCVHWRQWRTLPREASPRHRSERCRALRRRRRSGRLPERLRRRPRRLRRQSLRNRRIRCSRNRRRPRPSSPKASRQP